eukprot:TRINITY_DN394_c0_g1_i1.p1 TRINITY_DN394_c0_g1~~TRINITY_DN394_c0_g1_i1.p1  ORF type:complete len:126 (+),score=56.40 TRINITY_DN394_c0_g1_i1:33-380(+)
MGEGNDTAIHIVHTLCSILTLLLFAIFVIVVVAAVIPILYGIDDGTDHIKHVEDGTDHIPAVEDAVNRVADKIDVLHEDLTVMIGILNAAAGLLTSLDENVAAIRAIEATEAAAN